MMYVVSKIGSPDTETKPCTAEAAKLHFFFFMVTEPEKHSWTNRYRFWERLPGLLSRNGGAENMQ